MSFEIKKIYTDVPYADEIVYYTKLMAVNTTLKMKDRADNSETLDSLRNGDLYVSCIEGTATLEIFPDIYREALVNAGIVDDELIEKCMKDINYIPSNYKEIVRRLMVQFYVDKYEETNPYYRMLHGLPPVGMADYVDWWVPPEGVIIDLTKPVHEMSNSEVSILDKYGVLDQMIAEDPINREYMYHLGSKKIDYYLARRANRFDPLYVPTIESDAIQKMYTDKLDANKFYVLRAIYSEAYKYDSDYYDNFIAVLIIILTMVDVIARAPEFVARKEIFDIRSIQYIFKSYGVPYFEEIPLKFQLAMVKNLHRLLKYKSTAICMVEICSLFGFKNIEIFKYYLLRSRKVNVVDGEYFYINDEEGNEDLDAEYELKFLKIPLDADLDEYARIPGNYIDYDEITTEDTTWDGGLDHEEIKKRVLQEEFNFTRTKYMSIDSVYDVAKMSHQVSYFFNMLYDNIPYESLITVQVPFIEPGREFRVADLFTLLTVLCYYYKGVKDLIMDTTGKVLYVNGFNFKADLAQLAADIKPTIIDGVLSHEGTTLRARKHAKELIDKFIIPDKSIPSFNEMMDMFVNNMEVRDAVCEGMHNADNKRIYDIYKKLYDALMIVELTMDFYKNPETGDFWRDEEGDATFTEYLKHTDGSLYMAILDLESFETQDARNQYIANLVDSIVYALEEYIDTEEYQGLFHNLPMLSSEAVKQYIKTVINFYKSYKVDFLGLSTIYLLDDKCETCIHLIDKIDLNRYFTYNEYIKLYDMIAKMVVHMTENEIVKLIECVHVQSYYIKELDLDDPVIVRDRIAKMIVDIIIHSYISLLDEVQVRTMNRILYEKFGIYDYNSGVTSKMTKDDGITLKDRLYIYYDDQYSDIDQFMDKVDPDRVGSIGVASYTGNIYDTIEPRYIVDEVSGNSLNAITEEAVRSYMMANFFTKDRIVKVPSWTVEEASNMLVPSEKAVLDKLSFHRLPSDPHGQ